MTFDFYTQIYSLIDIYMNAFKYKSLYFHMTFNQNQFYKIRSFKIIFYHRKTYLHNVDFRNYVEKLHIQER